MSGAKLCPSCFLRYITEREVACDLCAAGYDPRGPGGCNAENIAAHRRGSRA